MIILLIALQIIPFLVFIEYYLTMYQQQYYDATRVAAALNWRKWFFLFFGVALLAIAEIAFIIIRNELLVMAIINAILALLYYSLRYRIIALKYTKRVQRIIGVCLLLFLGIIIPVFLLDPLFGFALSLSLSLLGYTFIAIAISLLNPIETRINRYYFQQAQEKVASHISLTKVAITGSFGKTTVKSVLNTLISDSFYTCASPKSINTPNGLTRFIRQDLQFSHQVLIAEMGVDRVGGMDKLLDLFTPDIALITAIGPQHLATFKSLENIAQEKMKLLQSVGEAGTVVINKDLPELANLTNIKGNQFYYSRHQAADLQAINVICNENGISFDLLINGQLESGFKSSLLGQCNVDNILSAIALALVLKVPIEKIRHNLNLVTAPDHRLKVHQTEDILIIDDSYNSNPVGFRNALAVLKNSPGYRILITPGLVEQGKYHYPANHQLAPAIADSADLVLLVGTGNTAPLVDGLRESAFFDYQVVKNLDQARAMIKTITKRPLSVLIENDLPDAYVG